MSKFESEKHNNADFIDWFMTVKPKESEGLHSALEADQNLKVGLLDFVGRERNT